MLHLECMSFPPNPTALACWMVNANPSSAIKPSIIPAFASPLPVPQNQVLHLKRPRTQSNTLSKKRLRSAQSVGEVTYPAPAHQASWSIDDLPKSVACTIHQGSNATSMDFHPSHHSLLTVGCSNGEISLWELGKRER
ncbi:hypothetical protein F3Y22_tig00110020pilonHSYRG00007 [Hibiscus syriacus]|uniref:Uncharacterized protein n=1 Tax=Hibiscus syriacus TaxID=106335 RepID=A0A6A3BMC6_HIBSY|nr:hypothetical protein F3Y22_tig00110020pilonHSYRG00007 [Hibiscus syriacus]